MDGRFHLADECETVWPGMRDTCSINIGSWVAFCCSVLDEFVVLTNYASSTPQVSGWTSWMDMDIVDVQ